MKWKIPAIILLLGLIILLLSVASKAKAGAKMMQDFIKKYVGDVNPNLSDTAATKIAQSTVNWCGARTINVFSFLAIMQKESTFNPKATGDSVSRGISQLTKMALDQLVKTGYIKDYDWSKLYETDYNIKLGTLYYLYCVRLAKNNRREAIARYRKTFDPDHPTAQSYATSVLAIRDKILTEFKKFKE